MFYSQFILAKKGPLGTIWIAAHLEGKLRKNHVTETNLSASIDSILYPEVPIALRLSGHLLLGVVRIYSRKVNYLYHDCSEALVKIKHAFHCSNVDLPPEASKVPFHSITLPEKFEFHELEAAFRGDKHYTFPSELVDDHHVSARDVITLQEQTNEETTRFPLHSDERFPGSFDPYSVVDEIDEEQTVLHASNTEPTLVQEDGVSAMEEDVLPPLRIDHIDMERENMFFTQNLRGAEQSGMSAINSSRLFEMGSPHAAPAVTSGNLAQGSTITSSQLQDVPDIEKLRSVVDQREPDQTFLVELEEELVPSSSVSKKRRRSKSPVDDFRPQDVEATPVLEETPLLKGLSPSTVGDFDNYSGNGDILGDILGARTPVLKVASISQDAQGLSQQKRGPKKKKKKPVFDDKPILPSTSMKKQLAGTDDLLRRRRNIPLTEYGLWRMGNTYNTDRFNRPSIPGFSAPIKELYSHITAMEPSTKHDAGDSRVNHDLLGANRMAEVDVSIMDLNPIDVPEASFSPLASNQNAEQIHADANGLEMGEVERHHSEGIANDEVKRDAEELHEADTLLTEQLDTVISMEADDRLPAMELPEALTNQAFENAVDVNGETPAQSLSSLSIDGQVLEKLDFLEDNRDTAFFHTNTDQDSHDRYTSYQRRESSNQNDNGWSVRTKCVAKYLKSVFAEAEAASSVCQVSLDSLLKGRRRKEAARMYFETLVLKSRGYINVEQRSGFSEIMLSATPLLSKETL